MSFYRKKPVVVEARQLGNDYDEDCAIISWCGGRAVGEGWGHGEVTPEEEKPLVAIDTLEGVMYGNSGDYIIRGVQGEFYPCKPDIFEATYELVS